MNPFNPPIKLMPRCKTLMVASVVAACSICAHTEAQIKPVPVAAQGVENGVTVDWASFLERNDMVWDKLPTGWDNAPFVGNGTLGTIFWQDKEGAFQFEVSRSDLYDHRRFIEPNFVLLSNNRLPNGRFKLDFGADKPSGKMRLDLWNAEVRGSLTSGVNSWEIRTFAAAQSDIIAVELSGPATATPPTLSWQADEAKSPRKSGIPPEGLFAYPPQQQSMVDGINVSVQEMPEEARFNTDGRGVGQYATAWTTLSPAPGRIVYLFSTKISYPGRTALRSAVDEVVKAKQAGLARLESEHRAWWHAYYPKSFLSIPNAPMESFYWIQMYKMGSASRQTGPIVDLMGPWYRTTNWPAIWWNLNIQLTYWPFYMANHLEESESLNRSLWKNRAALASNSAPYQADSFSIGRATGPTLEKQVGAEVGNMPWTMHNLWLYYRSTMDDRYLREELFPLMKGSFNYLNHIAVTQPDGKIGLPATASPEYTSSAVNASYTLACFRWLAGAIIEADERLKTNDPVAAECRRVLANLVPYEVDPATGIMVGKDIPFVNSHRHWSHLFMIYPFQEWDWNDPARRPLMEQSLKNWTDKPQGFTGFSYPAAASMHASAGQGTKALQFMQTFLLKSPLPNTLCREGSPVIETPLAGARTLQEMLMTSYGHTIRIFPGVPNVWREASFANLRAEGAFLVSAVRKGGATQFVSITSLAGEPCRVRTSLSGTVKAQGKRVFKVTERGGGVVEIDLAKGETVVLSSGGTTPNTAIVPVARSGAFQPWGGVKGGMARPAKPKVEAK